MISTPELVAYCAGFFDGEGCVNIRSGRERYFNLTIIIAQREEAPLLKFKELFAPTTTIGKTWRANRTRSYFRLTLCGDEAANALSAMLPYLIVKRSVAEVGIELQRLISSSKGGNLSPELVAQRKELAEKAAWLNTGRWATISAES